jgi:hypothetical protein
LGVGGVSREDVALASSYLKAMQLRKQLEEKAKETAQLRQRAEDALVSAETLLKSAKAADIDVGQAPDELIKAKNAMADRDYETADALSTKCSDGIKKAYDKVIETVAVSADSLLALVDDPAIDKSSITKLLEGCAGLQTSGKPEEALKAAKDAWEQSEKVLQAQLSAKFSAAQALIVTARNSGEDVSGAEDLLTRARSAMASQDYASAFKHTKDCLESVSGSLFDQVGEVLDDARNLLVGAREVGADVSKADEAIIRADEEVKKYDFERAMGSASLARNEAEKALTRGISERVEKATKQIQAGEEIDADVKNAHAHLARAKAAVKNGNFDEAIGALKACEEETNNAQFQRVLKEVSLSRSKFLIAKKIDIDVTEPVEFLNKAKESLKEGNYKQALEYAERGDTAIEKLVKDYQEAEEAITGLEQSVNDATESGIDGSAAASTLVQAKETLDQKDYRKVALLVHKGLSEVEGLLYRMAMEHVEIAEMVLNTGEKIGANMKEARDLFKEAVDSMKAKRFMQAATVSDSCASRAETLIRDHVSGFMMTVELAIDQVEGIDPTRPRELMALAKEAFDRAEYDKAYELSYEAFSIVDSGQSKKARESLVSIEVDVSLAREMGCSVDDLSAKIGRAKESLATKNYAQVAIVVDEVTKDSRTLQYGAAERMFSNAKMSVVEAKKLGIDITNMRETLKKAKSSFDLERYKETYDLSQAAQVEAQRMMALRTEAYNTITQAAAMVAEAKKNNADVEKVMSTLLLAKTAFERFDYQASIDAANKAKTETDTLMNLYNAANLLISFRDHIKMLQSLKVEGLDSFVKKAEDSKGFLKVKDYESAQRLLSAPAKEVRDKLANTIASLMSVAQSAIDDAKELRVNVDSAEAILSKAKAALAAEQYQEAVDDALAARSEVDRIRDLSQRAAKAVKEAHERVSECENLHADPTGAKLKLEDSMAAIKSSEYDKAISLAQGAIEEATRAEHQYVAETVNNFRLTIEKAKMDGTNVSAAERLLNQAKEAMEAANLKKALELAMRSEGELEKVGLQQEMAAKAIRTAEDKFAEAVTQSIHSSSAAALIESAKAELKKGDYVRALEIAIQSGDELHRTKEQHLEGAEAVRMAKEAVALATKIGADVATLKGSMEKAEAAMATHDYKAAQDRSAEALAEAKRVSYAHTSNKIVAAHNLLNTAARLSINIPDAGTWLAQARSFLDNSRYENAVELAQNAVDKAKGVVEGHTRAHLDEVAAEMSHAVQLGGDISSAEKLFVNAKAAFEKADYDGALRLAMEAKGSIVIHKKVDSEFVTLSGEANKLIASAKTYGIVVKEAEQLLSLAMAAKDSNYDQALKYARDSEASVQKALDEFKPDVTTQMKLSGEPMPGEWIEGNVAITNGGKTLGKDVKVQVIGAVEVEGALSVGNLRANGATITLPLRLKFNERGEVPLILRTVASRVLDGKEYTWESTHQFMVKAAEPAKPTPAKFVIEVASEPSKCAICMGNIKLGMRTVKCSCGRTTHEPCGMRVGKCPGCATQFAKNDLSKEQVDKELFGGEGKGKQPPAPLTQPPAPKPPEEPMAQQPSTPQSPSGQAAQAEPQPAAPSTEEKPSEKPSDSNAEAGKPAASETPKRKRLALKLR